jgi:hypothetical protein
MLSGVTFDALSNETTSGAQGSGSTTHRSKQKKMRKYLLIIFISILHDQEELQEGTLWDYFSFSFYWHHLDIRVSFRCGEIVASKKNAQTKNELFADFFLVQQYVRSDRK